MCRFLGAEYIVGVMLIENKKRGSNQVTLDTLGKFGNYLQNEFNQSGLNVSLLVSRHQFIKATFDFHDYFERVLDNQGATVAIALKSDKDTSNLEWRFVNYMPYDIAEFVQDKARKMVAVGA